MAVQLGRTGLRVTGEGGWPRTWRAIDAVLRGVGQVMLQDNSYTGALFLAGIFWNSWLFGIATLLGTAASTAAAVLLGTRHSRVRTGLYGFNGALVGIALLYFLQPDPLTWVCVVLAAAGSTVVMEAMGAVLRRVGVAPLTAPFVVVSWSCFLATASLGRLHATASLPTAGLPHGASVDGVVGVATLVDGLLKGVAEVFFQANWLTGVCLVVGLFVAAWRLGVVALAGSLIGMLVAWGMGAAEPAIRAGAFGFNNVLVAVALVVLIERSRWRGALWMAFALLVTPVVYAALSAALQPFGLPALTAPFVLVAWAFLLARPRRVQATPPAPSPAGE